MNGQGGDPAGRVVNGRIETVDALVCVEPGQLEVRQVEPPARRPGDVLVRPRRIGVCGTDYHIFEGKHPFLNYPRILGHELSVEIVDAPEGSGFTKGEVCAVNPYLSCGACHACRTGKPNCCTTISVLGVHRDGGMSGLLALPPENVLKAEGLSLDACASVEFLAIGAHAVRRGAVSKGQRVLVAGAGPIGLGTALFAKIAGGDVALLDLDAGRVRSVAAVAGVTCLPVEKGDDPRAVVDAATDGAGFDVVFDATGNGKAIEAAFDYVCHGGRLVLVSVVNAAVSFFDPDFHRKEMTVLGSRNATSEDFDHVIRSIRAGLVPVDRLMTHRTSLEDAAVNIPDWAVNKAGLIKALVTMD